MGLSQYDLNKINKLKPIFNRNKVLSKSDISVIKKLYFFALRLRMIEQSLANEYHPADQMRCPVHFCIGQEAIPAAISLNINDNDFLFCHHRSHGYALAKGMPSKFMFAELYGKISGSNQGFAGSQDISYSKKNFFAGAILAGSIGVAVGNALAQKIDNTKNIVFTCFGESATDQGIFWESLNYASLKSLPIIFICENNNYSVYSPQNKRQSGKSISDKAKNFGVDSVQINGNDAYNSYKLIENIVSKIKKNSKPYLIEAFTSRWSSHYGPEDDSNIGYREKNELNFWKKKCPLKYLDETKLINDKAKNNFINIISKEIKYSFRFAKKSKFVNKVNLVEANYSKPDYSNKIKDSKFYTKNKKMSENIFFQPKGY